MVNITQEQSGWMINDRFYFGPEKIEKNTLQLLTTKGEPMRYGNDDEHIIDFPGEYDLNGNTIRCWVADDILGYVVRTGGAIYAFLANTAILDVASFDDGTIFYVTDAKIQEEIEKMEIDGEVHVLGADESSTD